MKPAKILALLLAAVMLLSACTAEPPAQETDVSLVVTEPPTPSTEPPTEPPAEPPTEPLPTLFPTMPARDLTGKPYTPEEKAHFDSLRLPFDEALTFYIEAPDTPARMKFSIAPSGTEDWMELTCTGECGALDPHSRTYRQYQIPYDAKADIFSTPWRIKMEVDMDDEWNIEVGMEYRCEILDDIYIQDDISVLINRSTTNGDKVWVTDYVGKYFCEYCGDRFGLPDLPPRYFWADFW